MKIPKKINRARRKTMQALTKKIGVVPGKAYATIDKQNVQRILICRPNHRLGNQLLITPLLREMEKTFPHAKIDLFLKGNLGKILFKKYKNIDKIINLPRRPFSHLPAYFAKWFHLKKRRYDLVINIDKNSSSGRISTKIARSRCKIFGDEFEAAQRPKKDKKHLAKYPIYNCRNCLSKATADPLKNPVLPLDIRLGEKEIEQMRKTLDELVGPEKKTISLFTYATDNKCYSKTWWAAFHKKLKNRYRNHHFVEVLPKENCSQIDFAEPSFYSRDLRQICAFIANTEVFIGADSGMMHLAAASETPTIGLFCVTDLEKYQPYGKKSRGFDTTQTSNEEIFRALDDILIN